MYAIVEFKGAQYRAEKDQILKVPFLKNADIGSEVEIDKVLMIKDDNDTLIGKSELENASIRAEVVSHDKDKKIIIFKKKRRKGFEKKQGHRQKYSEIKILEILNQ